MKDTDIPRLKELAEPDFENGEGDADQKEGHEVGDKKSTAAVLDRETGESPVITKSHGSADGGHVKGGARGPFERRAATLVD